MLQIIMAYRYLIHAPFNIETDPELQKAWEEMEAVQKSGKAKSIGVSNYLPKHLDAVLKTAKSPPVINQVEVRLLSRRQNRADTLAM